MRRRPRGSGTILLRGSTWSIRVASRGRELYESGFRTKAEAEARLTLLRAEALQRRLGYAADPRLSPTLAQLAAPWLERRSAPEDRYNWKNHLGPAVGNLRPDKVGVTQIRAPDPLLLPYPAPENAPAGRLGAFLSLFEG